MRAVLIKGESRYDALNVFLDHIAAALSLRGFEATVLDAVAASDLDAMLRREAARPSDFVFTFNILGDYRDPDGRSLGQVFDAPHVVQYVDYPLTHWVALDRTAQDTALLMVDVSHVETVSAIYGEDYFAHVGFSPHGAFWNAPVRQQMLPAFKDSRPIPILFSGSYYEPQRPWWQSQPPVIASIFQRALDLALAEEWAPALAALDVALVEHGLDPSSQEVSPFRKLATHVHEQVRSHRRRVALHTAADLGLPIHVYGEGYDQQSARFSSFTLRGAVDMEGVVRLMGLSRLVLNINANFGAGSHERPLLAMAAGAAAATDISSFYARCFTPGADLATYRWQRLEEDLGALKSLAEDDAALHAMARAGQERVISDHGWSARVDAILEAAEAARVRLALRPTA